MRGFAQLFHLHDADVLDLVDFEEADNLSDRWDGVCVKEFVLILLLCFVFMHLRTEAPQEILSRALHQPSREVAKLGLHLLSLPLRIDFVLLRDVGFLVIRKCGG